MLDAEENLTLLRRYYLGDLKSKDKIIINNIDLVIDILNTNEFTKNGPLISNLVMIVKGFDEAIDNYNLENFGNLLSFSKAYIEQKIQISNLIDNENEKQR